jgi:hypothetical protein
MTFEIGLRIILPSMRVSIKLALISSTGGKQRKRQKEGDPFGLWANIMPSWSCSCAPFYVTHRVCEFHYTWAYVTKVTGPTSDTKLWINKWRWTMFIASLRKELCLSAFHWNHRGGLKDSTVPTRIQAKTCKLIVCPVKAHTTGKAVSDWVVWSFYYLKRIGAKLLAYKKRNQTCGL